MIESIWRRIARYLSQEQRADALIQRSLRTPFSHLPSNEDPSYMERFWLFNAYDRDSGKPKAWWCPWSIRIHHIKREDLDRHLHDHPWNARTIILKGWYEEKRMFDLTREQIAQLAERCPGLLSKGKVEAFEYHRRRAGDTARLGFGQYHSIVEVSPGGVWTLFISSRWQGVWGFLVDGVKVPWREYLGIDGHPNHLKKAGAHDLIETGDKDSFPAIEDRNGEVVLAYCRACGKGESELADTCPGKEAQDGPAQRT